MVKFNIEELLKKRGKSKYWLCKTMNIELRNLNNIIWGLTSSISLRYLEEFCLHLECSPNELITITYEKIKQ